MTAQELIEIIYDWSMAFASRKTITIEDIDMICNELNWDLSEDKVIDFLNENYS